MFHTDRVQAAFTLACRLHADQSRKGRDVPYTAHLLAVASLVSEAGGDEDQLVAALLHDAPEDQGGVETLELIRREFGDEVAHIVDGCCDTMEDPKPPWRPRKEAFIERMRTTEHHGILLVTCADKLHNARSTLLDLRIEGLDVWSRFSGGRDGSLWYYRELAGVYEQRLDVPIVVDLTHTVAALHDEG